MYGVHVYTPAVSSLTVAMSREPSTVKVHPGYCWKCTKVTTLTKVKDHNILS